MHIRTEDTCVETSAVSFLPCVPSELIHLRDARLDTVTLLVDSVSSRTPNVCQEAS